MKLIIIVFFLFPSLSFASFMFQYGVNYNQQKDGTKNDTYDSSRTFHKVFLGASVDGGQKLFLGWNLNSWSSDVTKKTASDTYAMTEMGPRLTYFFGDGQNAYITAEWNPYAKGEREKSNTKRDITGSSMGLGLGYRLKMSRLFGIGAGLHYHSLTLSEEKTGTTQNSISDQISNIMPMLELTFITR